MERIAQLLDDLDDLVYTLGLLGERIRKGLLILFYSAVVVSLQAGGVFLALAHPPIALATVILLFVALLYREVTAAHLPLEIV